MFSENSSSTLCNHVVCLFLGSVSNYTLASGRVYTQCQVESLLFVYNILTGHSSVRFSDATNLPINPYNVPLQKDYSEIMLILIGVPKL